MSGQSKREEVYIFGISTWLFKIAERTIPSVYELRLNKKTTILVVGRDPQKEAEIIKKRMSSSKFRNRSDILCVNFSYEISPYLDRELGFVYYRDFISQDEELSYFAEAYRSAEEFSVYIKGRSLPSGDPLVSAMYHTWADKLLSLIVLREISKTGLSVSQNIAIIDNPSLNKWFRINYRLGVHSYPFLYKKRFIEEQDRLKQASPFFKPGKAGGASDKSIIVLIDDSGSRVNLASALRILDKLLEADVNPVVLTGSFQVWNELSPIYEDVFVLPQELEPHSCRYFMKQLGRFTKAINTFSTGKKEMVWKLFSIIANGALFNVLKSVISLTETLDYLHERYDFKVALAINEGNFVPAGGVSYLKSKGVETVGVSPILYMDHPMCCFWPAEHHLVYGDQALHLMLKNGIDLRNVKIVGTEHYDRCYRRDRQDDRSLAEQLFPQIIGKKLVVIATESRPRQMVEIEPSTRLLSEMPDVITIIKLHPGDRPPDFEAMLDRLGRPDNVIVAEKGDTLALVNSCHLLVTMGSNLIIEAAVMGVPSLVYNFSGTPCPLDFVAEGLCLGAYTPEEFDKLARSILFDDEIRAEAMRKLTGISRYNGPNDGRSAERIADYTKKIILRKMEDGAEQ